MVETNTAKERAEKIRQGGDRRESKRERERERGREKCDGMLDYLPPGQKNKKVVPCRIIDLKFWGKEK